MIAAELAFLSGFQIWKPDLRLFLVKYNYRKQMAQYVSALFALIMFAVFLFDVNAHFSQLFAWLLDALLVVICGYISEWLLTRLNPNSAILSWSYRFIVIAAISVVSLSLFHISPSFAFLLMGLNARNSFCGIPHVKSMCLSSLCRRTIYSFEKDNLPSSVAEYAGCKHVQRELDDYVVTDYGIEPNVKRDQTKALQSLIDRVGRAGGGRIFFTKGKYYFHTSRESFIQINQSGITLEGEVSVDGRLLVELISTGSTVIGERNPWISPFFITTAEALQPSNRFFGLQFRKKSGFVGQSGSLTDPGSDGVLLEPEFATTITEPSECGDRILHVESSAKCGKYILLGMYNSTEEGDLIKDILGMEQLREEWTSARRAGNECAPSFQHLLEVKAVIDDHTIELTRPLLRSVEMKYLPVLYNVDMLEDIHIRNLKLNSLWNGLFHHHGIPLYYSVSQSQSMDYGWNGINMKRVAHGSVENVIIKNYTNPLYVLDSRNISVKQISISGSDGHQGIKVYQHACDNLFSDIQFYNHYADMMGGEGNAYGNVFQRVQYLNPSFNPVDFDFHGFSEGPMSPPAYNVFALIRGFRYIQSAAGRDMLPGCAQHNRWLDIITEGEQPGDPLFRDLAHTPKTGMLRLATAMGYAAVMMIKQQKLSLSAFWEVFRRKLQEIDHMAIPVSEHRKLFVNAELMNITTTCQK